MRPDLVGVPGFSAFYLSTKHFKRIPEFEFVAFYCSSPHFRCMPEFEFVYLERL